MRFIELYESSSYLLLETPQRLAWLIANRGPKLLVKYEEEKTHGVIAAETSRHIELMDGETPEEKLIKFIMSFDPTGAKNYSNWLCSRYMATPEKGGCRLEDLNASVTADLAMFEKVSRSRRIENGNLDAYKSLQDLEEVVAPFQEGDREVSNRADRAAGRSTAAAVMFPPNDPMRTPEHVDVLLDNSEMLILQLKTEAAARHFGENTNWCTTAGMFDSYNKKSPLYILCDRKKNSRVQWHFNDSNSQFMNEKDRSIDLNAYLKEHPQAFKVFRQQFIALLGVTTYGGQSLNANLFSPEDLAEAPVKTQVRLIKKASDVDKLPAILSEEGFYQMVLRRPNAKHNHWSERENGSSFDQEQFQKILAKYFKALKPAFFLKYMMDDYLWIFEYFPDKWKTDKVKDTLAEKLIANNSPASIKDQIMIYFGEDKTAWTPTIYEAFFDSAADAGWSAEEFPEKDFTDARMVKVLAANPEDIAQFHDRLNPKLVAQIIRNTASHDVHEVFENLPPEYRNKESAKALHTSANQFKAKRDSGQRDNYLKALAHFDPEHWSTKAERIAELFKGDFAKLPPRFHTKEFAAKIVAEQPDALKRIPAAFVDQNVVNSAMLHGGWGWIFDDVDPHIITPEMVLEGAKAAVSAHEKERTAALSLPAHFKTYRPMLDWLLETGTLPLTDPDWPDDAWTPEFVLKKVRLATRGPRPVEQSSYGYDYGRRNRYGNDGSTKTRQTAWDTAFMNVWRDMPEQGQTNEIIEAIIKEFPATADMLGEKHLTNHIMTVWMDAIEKTSAGASKNKALFNSFPKSAWSNRILAQAIKRSYIDEIPDEFKEKADPQTIIQMIASDKHHKTVDWSQVTPDMLITAIGKGGYTSIITRVPKDSPLLGDEGVVYATLRHAVDDERGFGASHYKKNLQEIWPPEKRGHWAQRDWDLAGGAIVPLEEVPAKFKHEDLAVKSVLRDPSNLAHIENPIEWLNENMEQITTAKGFKIDCWINQGIYFDGKQWIDDKARPHKKVGNGAYSYAKTQTGAKIAFIYGSDGELINGLAANLKNGESYSGSTHEFTSEWGQNSYGGDGKKYADLRPYRDVIEAVIEKHPEIEQGFSRGWSSKLSNLDFYSHPQTNVMTKVEKLPRKSVSKETSLTYVVPARSYGDSAHLIYDGEGENAPLVAKIVIDTSHGGGHKFEASKVYGTGKDHIRYSRDLMRFVQGPGDLASGTGPKFKESDLYRSCGLRGTGSFEWFTLFDEKIMEHGGMSIWRLGRTISIADDEHGLVATGKKAKDGTFALGEKFADVDDEKLEKIFSLMAGKL